MADIKATEVIGWTFFSIVAIIVLMIFISFCISMYRKLNTSKSSYLEKEREFKNMDAQRKHERSINKDNNTKEILQTGMNDMTKAYKDTVPLIDKALNS